LGDGGCNSTHCAGRCSVLKIFAVSEPRVLKMNMGINDAGKNESILDIDDIASGKIVRVIGEKGNFTRANSDSTSKPAPSRNDVAIYKCSVHFHVRFFLSIKNELEAIDGISGVEGDDEQ